MSGLLGVLGFLEFYLSQIGTGIVPKATVVALLVQAVAGAGVLWWRQVPLGKWLTFPGPVLWLLAIAALAMISAIWSADAPASLRAGGLLAIFIAATLLTAYSAEHAPGRMVAACVNGFTVGTVTMVALIAVKLLTDQALTRAVFNWFPSLQETPNKHVFIADHVVVGISEASSNRRVLIATLMLWPLAYALWEAPRGWSRTTLVAVAAASYATIFVLTKHQSSQVAVLLSAIAYGAMHLSRRHALASLAVAWALAVLLVVPAVQLLYTAQLHKAPWLFESARQRVVIWDATAEGVVHRPLLGIGAAATKEMRLGTEAARARVPVSDNSVARDTRAHAHNAYLQSWYELGAIGAAILLGFGLSVVWAVGRMPSRLQPVAAAQFTTVAGMLAFSFGLWQEWFLSAIALSVVALWLVEAFHNCQPHRPLHDQRGDFASRADGGGSRP